MKVKDLIVKLKNFSADAQVMVQGYEDGFDSVKTIKPITVVKNPKAAFYNGEYEETEKGTVSVVIIGNRR